MSFIGALKDKSGGAEMKMSFIVVLKDKSG